MEHINSGRSWSPELRLFLIHMVKQRGRLWRKFGTAGQDGDIRMTLWAEVQQEIGKKYKIYVDIEEIKKTWKNLKDNYLRVKKASRGTGCKPGSKKWYFYDELNFLDNADVPIKETLPSSTADMESEIIQGEPPKKKVRGANDYLTISIPVIDNRIHSKQEIPVGATVLDLDDDLADFAKITAGKWGALHEACQPGWQKVVLDNEDDNDQNSPLSDCGNVPIFNDNESPTKMMDQNNQSKLILSDVDHHRINMEIQRLRGIYHKAATVFFMVKGMPEGALTQILMDFDDYVYCNKKSTDIMNKVIKSCPEKKDFEKLFENVEKYRSQLDLNPPMSRWEQEDKTLGKNIKPYYLDHRNPLKVELTENQLAMRERLKHIQHRKSDNLQRTTEIQREIDRINGEMWGQPSVIRRTKLRKMLEDAEESMKAAIAEKEEIEEQFREQVKILEGGDKSASEGAKCSEDVKNGDLIFKDEPAE